MHCDRLIRLAISCLVLVLAVALPHAAGAFDTKARAAIMIDFRTGSVLFAKNPDERIPPASMSKLMTAYMVFDALKSGRLKEDDELPVSERAWRTGGSKMFVGVGSRVRVHDLIRGVIIQSGNDACVVFAEGLAGSEEAFAERMTKKGREIGLTGSHFANANGLPDPDHYMTVRDLATLAGRLIADFPAFYGIYSEEEFTFNNIRQFSRNPLLRGGVPGVDGLKTGYTDEAGYGLVVSAKRDDRRLILVMAGLSDPKERGQESERLLEYGFREFEDYPIFTKDEAIEQADVWLGDQPSVPVTVADDLRVTMAREARSELRVKASWNGPIPAPVAKGEQVGTLVVSGPGLDEATYPLVAGADVAEASWLDRMWKLAMFYVRGHA